MMNEKTKVRTSPMTESEMKKVILSGNPYIKENVYPAPGHHDHSINGCSFQ